MTAQGCLSTADTDAAEERYFVGAVCSARSVPQGPCVAPVVEEDSSLKSAPVSVGVGAPGASRRVRLPGMQMGSKLWKFRMARSPVVPAPVRPAQ
jgi:hypothetical protein